jgi:hypothetical protein
MHAEILFPRAIVTVVRTPAKSFIKTMYDDGMFSIFVPPTDDPEFCRIAAWAGYGDPIQYGIEHDIAHSFVANTLGYEVSRVVWADCHGGTDEARAREDKNVYPTLDDEEHLCNRLQRYANTGAEDEFQIIDKVFGGIGGLQDAALEFIRTARPWLCR